mmetsp:Transcript_37994/g.89279  ORF Transcript_37994/g.89279 Transcript_37994/m.89279 type:complete len:223 (+) Transcript_37994:769-1437(+)
MHRRLCRRNPHQQRGRGLLPRPARHPPAHVRAARAAGRAGRLRDRLRVCRHRYGDRRLEPPLRTRARHRAGRGRLLPQGRHAAHRTAVRAERAAVPLPLRVRLLRAPRLCDRRRACVRGATADGHHAGQQDPAAAWRRVAGDRRGDSRAGHVAHLGALARGGARPSVPRGIHQEPLHRAHVHHAGAGGAQEGRARQAQHHQVRVQGQERVVGRRLHRARHHL